MWLSDLLPCSSPPVRTTLTSRVPSGDHAGAPAPSEMALSFRASPPVTSITYTCALPPSRSDRKARRVPSGDHTRLRFAVLPANRLVIPCRRSMASKTLFRTIATLRPSGERRGAESQRRYGGEGRHGLVRYVAGHVQSARIRHEALRSARRPDVRRPKIRCGGAGSLSTSANSSKSFCGLIARGSV